MDKLINAANTLAGDNEVLCLDNCEVYNDVNIATSKRVLEIKGNCSIKSETPIVVRDSLIIRGIGENPTLKLIVTGNMQPAIGVKTSTGLSFGRYQVGYGILNLIVLDNVDVTIENSVENFSLGTYGIEEYPRVELLNNAKLSCPETNGTRFMKVGPEYVAGSTKHSRPCTYVIVKDLTDTEGFISDEVKQLRKQICEINSKYYGSVNMYTTVKGAEKALELLKLNPSLDISLLLYNDCNYIKETCCVLGLPEYIYKKEEFTFEMTRWPYIHKVEQCTCDVEDWEGISKEVINKKFNKPFEELTPFEVRYVYEMIPTYSFNFSGKTNEEAAKEWYDEMKKV